MDKQLCLWDTKAVRCTPLTGHNSSISKVKVDQFNIAVTSSYDASLLVWNLNTLECVTGLFKGHKDAVMTFEWSNSLIVSGGKDGSLAFWDINK
jgi:WD40 repeat protein